MRRRSSRTSLSASAIGGAEASSTTITSSSETVCASADSTLARIVPCALYAGMMTLVRGFIGPRFLAILARLERQARKPVLRARDHRGAVRALLALEPGVE